jgi:serralysin
MKTKHFSLKLAFCSTIGCAVAMAPSPAQAAFHLWNIRELYSDSSGNLQFIELFTSSSGQEFVGGQQIRVTSGAVTHTFTVPANLPGDSFNHAFLIGTSGIQGAGGPMPDYIMPSGFLFTGGATISFFGANSGAYTALPTDGSHSRLFGTSTDALNSPQNFAGQIGSVAVPEPSTVGLLGLGGAGLLVSFFRRKSR